MVEIISFAGRLKSGKSTLSKYLIEKYNYKIIAFADFMKHKVSEAFEIPLEYLYDPIKKEEKFKNPIIFDNVSASKLGKLVGEDLSSFVNNNNYEEYRTLMQFLGTDVFRKIDPDFHVKKTLSSLNDSKKYVLEDLRFSNELNYLKSFNSKIYYLIRPYHWSYSNHSSETSLHWSQFENIIYNSPSYSLDDFRSVFDKKLSKNYSFKFPQLRQYYYFSSLEPNSIMFGSYLYHTGCLKKLPVPLKFHNEHLTKWFINDSGAGDSLLEDFSDIYFSKLGLSLPTFFMLEDLKLWNLEKYPDANIKDIYNTMIKISKPFSLETFEHFWNIGKSLAQEVL